VLLSFAGTLLRVLANSSGQLSSLAAAGPWAAYVENQGAPGEQVVVLDARTGRQFVDRTGPEAHRAAWVAVDATGSYALSSIAEHTFRCGRQARTASPVYVGSIGSPHLSIDWSAPGTGYETTLLGDTLAYVRATTRCPVRYQLAIQPHDQPAITLPSLARYGSLSFDGPLVAAGGPGTNVIQLEHVPGQR